MQGGQERPTAPEFVPIDVDFDGGLGGTSEQLFGPLAVALLGYSQEELEAFRAFMIDMDADMVKIISCNGRNQEKPLRQVLEAPVPAFEKPGLGARRAVFLSGMQASEVMEVIAAYRDTGLPETVWAAAVPANIDRKVSELVEDIYGDHMYLKRNPEAAPR